MLATNIFNSTGIYYYRTQIYNDYE